MASGGEVGGLLTVSVGSEDLDDIKCQPCQDDGEILEAVGMCTDCQEYLCQRCFDGHKIPRPFRAHQLLNKQEMLKSKIQLVRKDKCTVRCSNHGEKNVKYYCTTHGQLSCSVCLNLDHRACQGVLYIPDVANDLKNNKEYRQADDRLSSLQEKSKKAAENAQQNSQALGSTYIEALEMIRVFRKEINDVIDRIEEGIVQKASEMKSAQMKEMVRTDEEHKRAEKELKAAVARIENFRKMRQNCNLFIEMMKIKTKLNDLNDEFNKIERGQSCTRTEIKFTPNTETLHSLKQMDAFGKLTVNDKRGQVQDTGYPRTIVKADHWCNIKVRCADDNMNCWISGLEILHNKRLLIVDRGNKKLKVVDGLLDYISSYLSVSSPPWDVAVLNNKEVAVTLPDEKKVIFVTTTGKLAVERTIQLREACHGIDYRDDKLAVSFSKSHRIKIIDLHGSVLHTIQPVKQGTGQLHYPHYVIFGPDSTTVYISSYACNEVACTKLDGTVVGYYKDNDLKCPRAIMLDKCGNVYICAEGSNTIHKLSPDCKKIRVMLTEEHGLGGPCTVSYSESDNKLYVGMYKSDTVKVYKVTLGQD